MLRELLRGGRKFKIKKGQVLNTSQDRLRLTLVESGYVMRYIVTNNGTFSIQSIYGPGSFYPLTLVFQLLFDQHIYAGPEVVYYETICDSDLYFIEKDAMMKKIHEEPLYYRDLLEESGKRFYSNIQMLENMSLKSSTQRLAHQLLHFTHEFGHEVGGSKEVIQIDLPLTHTTLSGILNVARETVSQSISDLRDLKMIKTLPQKIIVLDVNKLQDYAYR